MKRLLSAMLSIVMLFGVAVFGAVQAESSLDANLGNGEEWYIPEEAAGTYTKQEDGSYLHTATTWFCERVYAQKVGADATVEITFTPSSEFVYWGLLGRMDDVSDVQMDALVSENKGVRASVFGKDGVNINNNTASPYFIPGYAGGVTYSLKMVMQGETVEVYLNDAENPILTETVVKTTGDYVGFYLAQGENSVLHSFRVNGELVLGVETEPDPIPDPGPGPEPGEIPDTNLDPNLGDGREWYFPNGAGGTYTCQEDGTYLHTDTTWYCHRTYVEKVGPDCTLEFSFIPSNQYVYWGVYARLDEVTDTPLEPAEIRDLDLGILTQILGTAGLICNGLESSVELENYYAPELYTMCLELAGTQASVYLNDVLIGEYTVEKTTGDYVGFYVAQGEESVIQSFSINGETVLGVDPDQSQADAAIALIAELPEIDLLTLKDQTAVESARKVYDRLTEEQKALVTNIDKLEQAELKMNDLLALAEEEKNADIERLKAAIDAIGEVREDNVDEVLPKIEAAESLVSELSEKYGQEVLELVDNLADLTAARQEYNDIQAKPTYTLGMVNDDEEINASDALLVLQHSVKLITLEGDAFLAADVNQDGTIDANDALRILQYSVKIIDAF